MDYPQHDAADGPLGHCQITGSENLKEIINLGHQPPCDALLDQGQLQAPETSYPLRLMLCPDSGLAQLDYVVPRDKLYPQDYPYKAGISWTVRESQQALAAEVCGRFGLGADAFVVDIGSNDGTLLKGFQQFGCRVLGIEPTDVALHAQRDSVPTLLAFFTEALARSIVRDQGRARAVTLTNVFAHMAELGEAMRGIKILLGHHGVLVIENHYLLDVFFRRQFDTIYHEHIRTYSLRALCLLMEQYGMEVFDAERAERYGGNIRIYVGHAGEHPLQKRVGTMLREEIAAGLFDLHKWRRWADDIRRQRDAFLAFVSVARDRGDRIVGCSAPGRASTLLNYYGIKPDQIPYLGELQDSLKLGKFVPGCHIPVVDNRAILEEQPAYVVLMAWHYAKEIAQRLRAEGVNALLVHPLPEFRVAS